ncbi:MAG: hypothetical protein P8Y01_07390 [Woeseiaceae bacterium]
MQALGERDEWQVVFATPPYTEVDFTHVSILGNDDLEMIAGRKHLRSNGGHRRDRHDLESRPVGNPLRDRCGNTHADKRTRPVAEHDRIEVRRRHARFLENLTNHGHQQPRVFAFLFRVAFGNPILA